MADLVPIGTIPGSVSVLVDFDVLIMQLTTASRVTGMMVRHTDYDDGGATDTAVTVGFYKATGGSDNIHTVTILDQTQSIQDLTVFGDSASLDANEPVYMRVTSAGISQNLTGWIRVEGAVGTTSGHLSNIARMKEVLGITVTTWDNQMTECLAGVTAELEDYLQRTLREAGPRTEEVDSVGDTKLTLRNYPILRVDSLTENSVALVEGTDFEIDLAAGQLVRISGTRPIPWAVGERIVTVTYDHGYATVPYGIQQAALYLACWDFQQEKTGGKGRLGLAGNVLTQEGGAGYQTRASIWEDQRARLEPYRRRGF